MLIRLDASCVGVCGDRGLRERAAAADAAVLQGRRRKVFDGTPSTPMLTAWFTGDTVSLGGINQGFGQRRADAVYDIAFFRFTRPESEWPRRHHHGPSLFVVYRDGRGVMVSDYRRGTTFRGTFHGTDEVLLHGRMIGRTRIQLAPDGTATLFGDLVATSAVYARFDGDLVIAVSFDRAYDQLSVGRYDFKRGSGENVSPRGRSIETFSRTEPRK